MPKPCPFCGCEDVEYVHDYIGTYNIFYRAECQECGAQGPLADTEHKAYEEWDKRPDLDRRDTNERREDKLSPML